jgi:hypothetical protein
VFRNHLREDAFKQRQIVRSKNYIRWDATAHCNFLAAILVLPPYAVKVPNVLMFAWCTGTTPSLPRCGWKIHPPPSITCKPVVHH